MCLIEVISIFNAAVAAMLVAHIITCVWFGIGMTVQDGAKKPSKGSHQRILEAMSPFKNRVHLSFPQSVQEEGRQSWIMMALADELDGGTQYITSLRYDTWLGGSLGEVQWPHCWTHQPKDSLYMFILEKVKCDLKIHLCELMWNLNLVFAEFCRQKNRTDYLYEIILVTLRLRGCVCVY